jgi:hypothetical protein
MLHPRVSLAKLDLLPVFVAAKLLPGSVPAGTAVCGDAVVALEQALSTLRSLTPPNQPLPHMSAVMEGSASVLSSVTAACTAAAGGSASIGLDDLLPVLVLLMAHAASSRLLTPLVLLSFLAEDARSPVLRACLHGRWDDGRISAAQQLLSAMMACMTLVNP